MKELLEKTGAYQEGHFLLSSGKHSGGYCQCAKLLKDPKMAEKALAIVKEKVEDLDFDTIVGPAMGGIIPAYELGRQLGKKTIFSERKDGEMVFRRGFEIRKGEKILIVEDVVTTGKSSLEVKKAIEELGGEVIGIACIIDRSGDQYDGKLYAGCELEIDTYSSEDCPLCEKGIELIQPGSRDFKKE